MDKMVLRGSKGIFRLSSPLIYQKRYRGKINIQRPKPPHFEKAKFIELSKPWFISQYKGKTPPELCKGFVEVSRKKEEENPFQNILARELQERIYTSKFIGFFHINPMISYQQFRAFALFKKQNMFFKNYGKKTLEIAVKGTVYEPILEYYVSRNMMLFCPEPNLKKVLQISKRFPQIILLYGIYEGKLISRDEIVYYSAIPNIQTAQLSLVQALDNIGGNIVNQLNSHQTTLVANLEERMKQLDVK